ncbi:MAG: AAA family ATPase, partial [Paraprevotella sp.]|nr:AAA family ATPase [Paraprevotella sp.]
MALQNLPIGIQNFESLRKDGYLYVDKTAQVYKLATTGRYYFLSRPRRFGKSLLLSTLHAYFEGKRELFEGLAISALEQKWETYPILHLDLNTQKYESPEALENILDNAITQWEELYGAKESERSLSLRFLGVIRRASEKTGRRVVILIDEYDKPMLQAIGNEPLQEAYRNTLKAFYGALKSGDQYIRFAMLTGVTKFGKVSVFSDLNNLNDISMDWQYNSVCGITDEELDSVLHGYTEQLAARNRMTVEAARERLRRLY